MNEQTKRYYYIIYKNDCYESQKDHGADETHFDGKIHTQKLIIYNESDDMIIAKGFYLGRMHAANSSITPFKRKDVISIETLADALDRITCKVNTYAVGCSGIFYCSEEELDQIVNIIDYHIEREKLIFVIGQISKFAHSIRVERDRYNDTISAYKTFKENHQDDIDKIMNETEKYNLDDYVNELIPNITDII